MSFFSRTILRWQEPEAFRVSEEGRSLTAGISWLRLDLFIPLLAVFTLVWNGHQVHGEKGLPPFFGAMIRILFVPLAVLLVPYLMRLFPGSVVLYSNGIMKMGMQSMLRFKDVTGFGWSQKPTYYVLRLISKKGPNILVGVPDPIIRQKINEVLKDNGLKEVPTVPIKKLKSDGHRPPLQ